MPFDLLAASPFAIETLRAYHTHRKKGISCNQHIIQAHAIAVIRYAVESKIVVALTSDKASVQFRPTGHLVVVRRQLHPIRHC